MPTLILPRPDEALSSWLALTLGRRHVREADFFKAAERLMPGFSVAVMTEPDYPIAPGWRDAIAQLTHVSTEVLDGVGNPPSPWLLRSDARRSVCLACLAEDGPSGRHYMRQAWTDAWRTLCLHHGLPLIEAPAVGWSWATVGRATRRAHRRLMRQPGILLQEHRALWRKLPPLVSRCVGDTQVALHRAWEEYYSQRRTAEDPFRNTQIQVWDDVLTLVSNCWTPMAQASLAASALPAQWVNRTRFLRTPPVPPSEAPSLALFRATADPAVRRVSLLVAGDALLGFSHQPRADSSLNRYRWGWKYVVATLNKPARLWLVNRSRDWPVTYRAQADEWVQMALAGASGEKQSQARL